MWEHVINREHKVTVFQVLNHFGHGKFHALLIFQWHQYSHIGGVNPGKLGLCTCDIDLDTSGSFDRPFGIWEPAEVRGGRLAVMKQSAGFTHL